MLKVFIIILGFLFFSLLGISKSYSLKNRKVIISKFIDLIEYILREIKFSKKNILEILKQTENDFCFTFDKADIFSSYLQVKEEKKNQLTKEDWNVLDAFFLQLGKSDTEGQISLCSSTIEHLKKMESEAEIEVNKYSKMYTSLGILTGLFFIVISI